MADSSYKHVEIQSPPPPYYAPSYEEEGDNNKNAIIENSQNRRQQYSRSTDHGYHGNANSNKALLRPWKSMRYLVIVELLLAIIGLGFGIACVATYLTKDNPYANYCVEGSGIWVGVLCLVTAIVGLLALGIPTGRRCPLVAHLVLCIVCAIGCGFLLVFSSIWTSSSSNILRNQTSREDKGFYIAILIFNVILIIVAIAHMVLSIVSASLICYNFNCCRKNERSLEAQSIAYQHHHHHSSSATRGQV